MTQIEKISAPERAAQLLDSGRLIAFPTETVYGLGVDATNPQAVERLFAVKGRPTNNPLIVHVADVDRLTQVAARVPALAHELLERFSPGPLTVVVPKHPAIVPSVTAGLDTVGVRIPDHELTLAMLRACSSPIAAPSANRSGKPSSTTVESVLEDFRDSIDGVLVATPTRIGLESTVVDCLSSPPRVLRPGAVTLEQLRSVSPDFVMAGQTNSPGDNSPGRLHPHYRPTATVHLFDWAHELEPDSQAAYLAIEPHPQQRAWGWYIEAGDVETYAAKFYETLREVDRRGLKAIYCQRVGTQGTGAALMDRLNRAAER